jgi:hypothetical protein
MSELFNFITKKNITEDIIVKEEKKKPTVFYYIKEIYNIINNRVTDTNTALDDLLSDMDENEYYFLAWALNHYLVYNDFTRKNIEMFVTTNYWLKPKEYVYFYVKFMSDNGVRFPKYMSWYKLNIDSGDKKYHDILKDEYDLEDEDIENLTNYMKNNMSLREICINLQYVDK